MKEEASRIFNWKITGFFDAEGCISFGVSNNKPYYEIKVTQSQYSMAALEIIKTHFGVGTICLDNRATNGYKWHVTNRKDFEKVLEHFKKYPLKTSKQLDLLSFIEALATKDLSHIQLLADGKNRSRPYAERLT